MRVYTFEPGSIPDLIDIWSKAIFNREEHSPPAATMYTKSGALNRGGRRVESCVAVSVRLRRSGGLQMGAAENRDRTSDTDSLVGNGPSLFRAFQLTVCQQDDYLNSPK